MTIILSIFGVALFVASILAGIVLAFGLIAILSPFMKESWKHNADAQALLGRFGFFVEIEKERAVVIERAGKPISIYYGGKDLKEIVHIGSPIRSPIFGKEFYGLFKWYQEYIYEATGMYAYVPFFTKPKVIPLPRFELVPNDGENKYVNIKKDEAGFFTNHVRLQPTNWYFRYSGVDIEGIPFKITGSILYMIGGSEDEILNAYYKTDAWNVLLDQVDNTVIRGTVRDMATIDSILGRTNKDIWEDPPSREELFDKLSKALLENLQKYTFPTKARGETLKDFGIHLIRVLINDFEPELTPEELLKLRAPVLGRQEARATALRGAGVAEAQRKLVEAHENGGEASQRIIEADALVRAMQNGTTLDALLATFIQKNRKDN